MATVKQLVAGGWFLQGALRHTASSPRTSLAGASLAILGALDVPEVHHHAHAGGEDEHR